MDEFYHSEREFLILERVFSISSNWIHLSLIITKSKRRVRYDYNGLTITNLKQVVGTVISENSIGYYPETSRKYPLYRELINIGKGKLNSGEKIPFQIPCLIGGQTFENQIGYGSEYCGEDLVYEGKKYGERR
jgi:hypothetical protein